MSQVKAAQLNAQEDYMPTTIARIHPTKGRRLPPEVLTRDEVRRLMAACSKRGATGSRNRALIAVMWRGGLRISEALDLAPSDLDPDRGLVRVKVGKGGAYRSVGMDHEAFALIDRWMDVRRARGISGRAPVFCTLAGARVSTSYVRQLMPRLARRAGIERRCNPHSLRHTMAAEMRDEGAPLDRIQAQLGHASLDGTSHYLRRIAPTDLADGARSRPAWTTDEPAADPRADEVAEIRSTIAALVERLDQIAA
jgi:site-specific recombinase XerD